MKIKLLIAEDNDKTRVELGEFLGADADFELVGLAKDGLEALEMVEKGRPDLLLLDLILPELDGFGVMEGMAALGLKSPKVVILSALCTDAFISKAIRSGAAYFMAKPYDLGKLKARLLDIVAENRPRPVERQEGIDFSAIGRLKTKSLEEKITGIFITVGIPAHIKGYQFLREAVKMTVDMPDIINSITKRLYPGIAEKYDTTASKVERAIRHAIEVAWNRGKIENINQLFGVRVYTNNEKPTNGEFIALVADKMLIEGA
jgi:two-component system response regulator (stage 0 sporulation protein A)